MRVDVIAQTWFNRDKASELVGGEWESEGFSGADLAEFAGRSCYESWNRPNPATTTSMGYIGNIIEMGHFSVLEHGSVTFRVSGVSRSLSHELVRHRHISPSQQSQRFVKILTDDYVVPPLFRLDQPPAENEYDPVVHANRILAKAWSEAIEAYYELIDIAKEMGVSKKEAHQAARAVLPNMTPTHFVITANHRTWREFITKRGAAGADDEIRELALEILTQLKRMEPEIYQDMSIGTNKGKTVVFHGGTE